jgi:hypothetical protein
MRVHFWSFLLSDEGTPIAGADISVYLAESSTVAYVYTSESGATETNSDPQATTDSTGYFEFWVGDSNETYGYSVPQKFRLAWLKAGVADGFIDNIDILPAGARFVSETVTSWTSSGASDYADVTHNLQTLYPLVQLYDSSDELLDPTKIEGISVTVTRVWVPSGSGNVDVSIVG